MNEAVLRFGDDARLAGILARPARATASLALVCITAGLVHRPGPYRLYTELTRTAAALGIPALRFDVSGIGESHRAEVTSDAEHRAMEDVRAALDALQAETGCRRFVLLGLCSGAEVAHLVALADARVHGVA